MKSVGGEPHWRGTEKRNPKSKIQNPKSKVHSRAPHFADGDSGRASRSSGSFCLALDWELQPQGAVDARPLHSCALVGLRLRPARTRGPSFANSFQFAGGAARG